MKKYLVVLLNTFLLGGCAAAARDSGFDDVQTHVRDRLGMTVQWRGETADDRAVDDAVHGLLSQNLTADSAVQIALLNNRNLQATYEDLGIAQADVVQAGLLKNPIFSLSVRFPDRAPSGAYVDPAVSEDFLAVLLIPARRRLASAQFEQAKLLVADAVLKLAAETESVFYDYQSAAQIVELRKTAAEAGAAAVEAAERMHEAGNISDLVWSNEQIQDAQARIDLSDAQAEVDAARETLNEKMGLADEQLHWTTNDKLADLPAHEIDAQNLGPFAISQRLDLAAAHQEIESQARALGVAKASRFIPEGNAGVEAEKETDGQWRTGPAVGFPIPLFDQGQAAVPRGLAMLRQSRDRYEAMKLDVQSQVRAAGARMLAARKKAEFYQKEIIPLQHQITEQTQLQYNGMLSGVFQLLAAKQAEIDATARSITVRRDYWLARSDLQRACGGRLPPASSAPTTQGVDGPATGQGDHP